MDYLIGFCQTYYILRWRWELKLEQRLSEKAKLLIYRSFVFFVLGVTLSVTGIFVFISSHNSELFF